MMRQENGQVFSVRAVESLLRAASRRSDVLHSEDDADITGARASTAGLDTKSSLRAGEFSFSSGNNGNYFGRERLKTQMKQDTRPRLKGSQDYP